MNILNGERPVIQTKARLCALVQLHQKVRSDVQTLDSGGKSTKRSWTMRFQRLALSVHSTVWPCHRCGGKLVSTRLANHISLSRRERVLLLMHLHSSNISCVVCGPLYAKVWAMRVYSVRRTINGGVILKAFHVNPQVAMSKMATSNVSSMECGMVSSTRVTNRVIITGDVPNRHSENGVATQAGVGA